jgi:hypothetical protein
MANGMTRNALAQIQLKKGSPQSEMNEEMIRLNKKQATKIPLKNPSVHNHSK